MIKKNYQYRNQIAAAKPGLIFVPLNYRLVTRELKYQINQCQCRLPLFYHEFCDHIDPIRESLSVEKDKYVCVSVMDNGKAVIVCKKKQN